MKLAGRVAIVTGGGSGIGKTIAITLANNGATVVIVDIARELAERASDEIKSLGRPARAVEVDVSNSQQVNRMVEGALSAFGRIDERVP